MRLPCFHWLAVACKQGSLREVFLADVLWVGFRASDPQSAPRTHNVGRSQMLVPQDFLENRLWQQTQLRITAPPPATAAADGHRPCRRTPPPPPAAAAAAGRRNRRRPPHTLLPATPPAACHRRCWLPPPLLDAAPASGFRLSCCPAALTELLGATVASGGRPHCCPACLPLAVAPSGRCHHRFWFALSLLAAACLFFCPRWPS